MECKEMSHGTSVATEKFLGSRKNVSQSDLNGASQVTNWTHHQLSSAESCMHSWFTTTTQVQHLLQSLINLLLQCPKS